MAASTTADGAVPEKSTGGSKKKLIIIIAACVALIAAGGGAWYFLMAKHSPKKKDAAKQVHKAAPIFVKFDQFTVNLLDEGGDRYLQTEFVLEVSGKDIVEPIQQQMPILRSSILLLLSNKLAADIATKSGKSKLADQIIAEIRARIHSDKPDSSVDKIHFASFVIQ
jgi:flagellar protein FliL